MTDKIGCSLEKARHLHPSSLDEATLEGVLSLFDEKAIGDRRADQRGSSVQPVSWLLYHWLWNNRSKQFTQYQVRLSAEDAEGAERKEKV